MTRLKTPWFDAKKHNPVRVGWYEFRSWKTFEPTKLWWTGDAWKYWPTSSYAMYAVRGNQWRGLLK